MPSPGSCANSRTGEAEVLQRYENGAPACCNTAGANQKNIKAILATETRQRQTWHDRGREAEYERKNQDIIYRRARTGQNCSAFVYGSEELEKQQAKGKYKRAYGELNHEQSPSELREGADS